MSDTPSGRAYEAPGITVWFDADVCQHSGNCLAGLAAVFDSQARPWIQPANAPAEEVAAQVRRCPSGALQYRLTP
jgi:uncharacterized Fe-S cluster protein YjdI